MVTILEKNKSNASGGDGFFKSCLRTTNQTFEGLFGIDNVRDRIKHLVDYSALFTDQVSTIIFYGPPGTGKSSLANAIANRHSNGNIIIMNGTELLDPTVGVAERGIKAIFKIVTENKDTNYTIFMDEADVIFNKQTQTPVMRTVKLNLVVQAMLVRMYNCYSCNKLLLPIA